MVEWTAFDKLRSRRVDVLLGVKRRRRLLRAFASVKLAALPHSQGDDRTSTFFARKTASLIPNTLQHGITS